MYYVGHANKNLNKSGQNDKIMGILNFQGHKQNFLNFRDEKNWLYFKHEKNFVPFFITKFQFNSAKRGTIMYIGSIEQKSQKVINISKLSLKFK